MSSSSLSNQTHNIQDQRDKKENKELGPSHKTLIFGATGATGKHIVKYATQRKDEIYVYVRNPDKISLDVKNEVHIIQGDLTDTAAVSNAVKQAQPDSIIIASAHIYKSKHYPLNAAAVPAMVKALEEMNLIRTCRLIFLSGLFVAPRDEPLGLFMRAVRCVLVSWIRNWAAIEDNTNTTNYLLYEANKTGLQFTIVRMGGVAEEPSKGFLVPVNYIPKRAVAFQDMGLFLVNLAHGEHAGETVGKAIAAFYPNNA